MGAQIAAHLANTGVEVVLLDLPAKEGDRSGIVNKALKGLAKLKPNPFMKLLTGHRGPPKLSRLSEKPAVLHCRRSSSISSRAASSRSTTI